MRRMTLLAICVLLSGCQLFTVLANARRAFKHAEEIQSDIQNGVGTKKGTVKIEYSNTSPLSQMTLEFDEPVEMSHEQIAAIARASYNNRLQGDPEKIVVRANNSEYVETTRELQLVPSGQTK